MTWMFVNARVREYSLVKACHGVYDVFIAPCSVFRLRADELTCSVKGHIQGWVDTLGALLHGIAKHELDSLCDLFEVGACVFLGKLHSCWPLRVFWYICKDWLAAQVPAIRFEKLFCHRTLPC